MCASAFRAWPLVVNEKEVVGPVAGIGHAKARARHTRVAPLGTRRPRPPLSNGCATTDDVVERGGIAWCWLEMRGACEFGWRTRRGRSLTAGRVLCVLTRGAATAADHGTGVFMSF